MQIEINVLMALYKEELAKVQEALIIAKATQHALEKENAELKARIENLEKVKVEE